MTRFIERMANVIMGIACLISNVLVGAIIVFLSMIFGRGLKGRWAGCKAVLDLYKIIFYGFILDDDCTASVHAMSFEIHLDEMRLGVN